MLSVYVSTLQMIWIWELNKRRHLTFLTPLCDHDKVLKKKKKKPNGGCHTKLERSPFYTASEESSTLKCLPRKARQTSHRLNIVHESSRGEIHWYKTLPVRFRLKKKQKNLKNTSTADTSLYCPSKQERGAKKHRRKRGRKNTVENGAEKTQ